MHSDLEFSELYGIHQSVDDTTGSGGLLCVLRNTLVVADITRKADDICPQAFFVNHTNPISTLTRAVDMLRSAANKTVGLFHEW